MLRRNVAITSTTFHFLSIPRFSCTIIECRKSVPVSQGSRDEFSTGSHAQYPPHPSSSYSHHIPSTIPIVRKNKLRIAHSRKALRYTTCRHIATSAVIANADGMVDAMRSRYRIGG